MIFLSYIILFLSLYMILHNFIAPQILKVIVFFINDKKSQEKTITKISFILPVFNEETQIVNKLSNTALCLNNSDIPYEVLIGCDGSQDKTPETAKEYIQSENLENFKVFEFENEGKGQTINKLVRETSGDLIISTDCDTEIKPGSIEVITKAFNEDKKLGCLSCVPVFQSENMGIQAKYWNYEHKFRDIESKLGKLIVVTGWLYAYKKSAFKEIPSKAMADDLWIPLTILLQDYKSIHLKEVKCLSEKTDETTEVKRRKRVISGGVDIVKRLYSELLKKPLLFFIVFSHKINRWLLPLWAGLFFIFSLIINPLFLLLYSGLFFFLLIYLGPQKFFNLISSVISPVFSIIKAIGNNDLSKWGHTRKNSDEG